ncbi:hypothetical protein [Leuconostoc suionicum]|uniref:hypothetical protein n=1 Tax=Leuconostoc suionicum TaxID=1511761 RepID=UPI0032DFB9AA
MTTTWTDREILKSYFRGIIDLQIEYMNNYPEMNNDYRRDNEAFIKTVKTVLDEFSSKLTPELKDMYVSKYKNNKPFIEFYNVCCSAYRLYYVLKQRIKRLSQQDRTTQGKIICVMC